MKRNKITALQFAFAITMVVVLSASSGYCQDSLNVWLWYGGFNDTLDVSINQTINLDLFYLSDSGAYSADCHFCLGAQDKYIDTLLSQPNGQIFYPFTLWVIAEFLPPQDSVPGMIEGWTSQSFIGFASFLDPVPFLYTLTPTRILTWSVHTANDSVNIGDDARAIGDEGRNSVQGATNVGDTLGIYNFYPNETHSIFHFTGGGYIEGTVTDFESNPLQGVTIVNDLTLKETTTDENGFYHMGLYPATHALSFSSDDYIDTTVQNLNVIVDQTIQLDMVLHQLGSIEGVVSDTASDPLANIMVTLVGPGVNILTDSTGFYSFADLDAGTYDISFTHPAYIDSTIYDVAVSNDVTTVVDVALYPVVVGIDDDSNLLPLSYNLNQNYPNPFNATTNIEYSIAENARVTLEIFDLLGKRVETLVDEFKSAGIHSVNWQANDLPSGIYFYRITANDFIKHKQMLLLK